MPRPQRLQATTIAIRTIAAFMAVAIASVSLPASAVTWIGTTDNLWSTSTNWSAAPIENDDIVFSGALNLANVNDTGLVSLTSVTFANGDFNVSGNALEIADRIVNSAGTNVWGINTTFSGVGLIEATSGTLTLSGTVAYDAAAAGNTLTVKADPGTQINLTNALTGGTGSVIKTGTGTLTLSGTAANTNASPLVVNGGVVLLNKSGVNALGSGGAAINSNTNLPATLRLGASNQIDDSAVVALDANGGQLALFDLNDFSETVGGITAASTTFGSATVRLGASGVLTLNGNITLNNNRNATGNTNREVLVTGTGTYGTAGLGGAIDLGGAVRTFTINSNNTQANNGVTIETVIQNGGLIKAGNTALLLRNANTFTGGLTVTGGVVDFNADNQLGDVANVITLNGGGLQYNNNAAHTLARTLNVAAGGGILNVSQTSGPLTISTSDLIKLDGVTSATMTKGGAGPLNLLAAQPNFAGAWRVTGGALQYKDPDVFGAASLVVAGGTARSLAGLDSTPGTVALGVSGLNATYYNFGTNEGGAVKNSSKFAHDLIVSPERAYSRIEQTINIPNSNSGLQPPVWMPGLTVGNNQENVGAFWKGLINITTAGSYTFESGSDDGSALYIDGQLVVDNDGGHGYPGGGATGAPVNLSAGWHAISLRYGQGTGGAAMVLNYTGPDTNSNKVLVGSIAGSLNTGTLTAQGPALGAGPGGIFDVVIDTSVPSLTYESNGGLTLNSQTLGVLKVDGPTTLSGNNTLTANTAEAVFNGAIGGSGGLTLNGNFRTTFNAANTFGGGITVTAGQLLLNATGGPAITGSMLVNVPTNASNRAVNVRALQAGQFDANSNLTVSGRSQIDLGSFDTTLSSLTLNDQAVILGSGKLTITNYSSLASGVIMPGLGGNIGVSVYSGGTVVLAGNGDYTGPTYIYGALNARHSNALGATGSTNGTIAEWGGQLQVQDNITTSETVTLASTGVQSFGVVTGALRNVSGVNTLSNVGLSYDALIRSDAGRLVLNGLNTNTYQVTFDGAGAVQLASAPIGGGSIVKNGSGTLIYATNQASFPTATWNSGAIGFTGAQSFGAYALTAGKPLHFYSDPGAGVSLTAVAGSTVVAQYAADQALLGRIQGSSSGALLLGVDSGNNLDFSAHSDLNLGAVGSMVYSGALTPGANGYNLGGGGEIRIAGSDASTAVVNVNAGTRWVAQNSDNLGGGTSQINLNGGTIVMTAVHGTTGFGNSHTRFERAINVGAAGGGIDVPNRSIAIIRGNDNLQGSGTLTKLGYGELALTSTQTAFTGQIVVGPNGGTMEVRGDGALRGNVAGITVHTGSTFRINDRDGSAFVASSRIADRLGDSIPIELRGGILTYSARDSAGNVSETIGAVTLAEGRSRIETSTSNQGAQLTISNLVRNAGGGTVGFGGSGTVGATGNNTRILLTQLNGAALGNTAFLGGWADIKGNDFAAYSTATGVVAATYVDTGTAETAFQTPANIVNLNGSVALTASREVLAMRIDGGASRALTFTGGGETLYVNSGGLMTTNANTAHSIGTTASRGYLTAGPASGNSAPQELFIHTNQNTMTIHSSIIDNNGQPVALVKTLGGTVSLTSSNNYSGGTRIYGGRINATVAGSLGWGNVVVKSATLELNQPGASNGGIGYVGIEAINQSEIYLNNASQYFTSWGDRFIIRAGSMISGQATNAGQGLASLTRTSSQTPSAGQVYLEPGAIVRVTSVLQAPDGAVLNPIQNLGTDADLYLNPGGSDSITNPFFSVTIGAGTPWKGLSSGVGSRFAQGSIIANSDFYLQGLGRDGGYVTYAFGKPDSPNAVQIINNASGPIRAFIEGAVSLDDDQSPIMPNDLTFVVTPGAILQPNFSRSFGTGPIGASVLVQAGGTLDPGGFVPTGAAANQPANVPYPADGPINANVTVEAGGRLILNDGSGLGGNDSTITIQKGGIVQIENSASFLGNRAGNLIRNGQLAFEPGGILRQAFDGSNTSSTYGLGQLLAGQGVVYQVYGGNRRFTSQMNPFVSGIAANEIQDIVIGAGGGLTNDSAGRSLSGDFGGRIVFAGDGFIAATTNTTFNIEDDLELAPGVTVTLGSNQYVDGDPKKGVIWFNRASGNVMGLGSKFSILGGVTVQLEAANAIGDLGGVEIQNGGLLRLSANSSWETIGALTGSGAITSNEENAHVQVGADNSSFTFNGSVVQESGRTFQLAKMGTGDFTLTSTLGSPLRDVFTRGGRMILSGPNGKLDLTSHVRLDRSGTLVFDNSTDAVDNRLSGKSVEGRGGSLILEGNDSVAVTETLANLYNGGGGMSTVRVNPGDAATTLVVGSIEAVDTGTRAGTYVFEGAGVAGTPTAAATNGLIKVTTPNWYYNNGNFNGTASTLIGTPVMWTRPDLLVDVAGDGALRFATQNVQGAGATGIRALADSEYFDGLQTTGSTMANVKTAGSLTATGDTRIGTLTMTDNASLTVSGTMSAQTTTARVLLNSAAILTEDGANASVVSPLIQTHGGRNLYVHTLGDSTLTLNGVINSDRGLIKTGDGTLLITGENSARSIRGGYLGLGGGTVELDAGVNGFGFSEQGLHYMRGINIRAMAGTLELGGNSQSFHNVESHNPIAGNGAIITSSSAANVRVSGGGTLSGGFAGAITLIKDGNNTFTLTDVNTYSGETQVRGGTLTVTNRAILQNTSKISMYNSTLSLDSRNLEQHSNRVPAGVNVDMTGSQFQVYGWGQSVLSETLGTVTLLGGRNELKAEPGNGGFAQITVGNLVRDPNAVVNFQTGTGASLGGMLDSGPGAYTGARILLNQVGGVAPTSGFLGGWAVTGNENFVYYDTTRGAMAINNTRFGAPDYVGMVASGTTNLTANVASDNASVTDNTTINSLRLRRDNANTTVTITAGKTLDIASGGLILRPFNGSATVTITGGSINTANDHWYIYAQDRASTIASAVTGASVTGGLVKAGSAELILTGANSYAGKTYVHQGTLTLNNTLANFSTIVAVPGDLEIRTATVRELAGGQIKSGGNITMNGGSRLEFFTGTAITVNALAFLNDGNTLGNDNMWIGHTAGDAANSLSIAATNAITVEHNVTTGLASLSGNLTSLRFAGLAGSPQYVDVNGGFIESAGVYTAGLYLNAPIDVTPSGVADGGLIKTGDGMLELGGGTIAGLSGGLNIAEGLVRVSGAGALGAGGAAGPITTVQSGAVLMASGGNVTGNVTLKEGAILGRSRGDWSLGAPTLTDTSATILNVAGDATVWARDYGFADVGGGTINIFGRLTGTGNLDLQGPTLTGTGTFRLGNPITGATTGANDYSGTITVGTNVNLLAQADLAGQTSVTGSTLGSAVVALNGGRLQLRDDGATTGSVSNQTVTWGNNVLLSAHSAIDANRTQGSGVNNTVALGNLSVSAGSHYLLVDSGNGYRVRFDSVTGPGTLVKTGNSTLELNTVTGANLALAGPIGLDRGQATGLNLTAASNAPASLSIGGVYQPNSGQSIAVSGVLEVTANTGVVNGLNGVTTGANNGALVATDGATISATTLKNYGVITGNGANSAVSGTAVSGTGFYHAYDQPLAVQGALADDGATATTMKVAGNNTVTLRATANATNTGGAEVHSGTLRLAPTADGVTSIRGNVEVLGVSSGSSGVLQADAGNNTTTTINGNVANAGTVKVTSGTLVVQGAIGGTSGYMPGLLQGAVAGRDVTAANTGNLGIQLEPVRGQNNLVTNNLATGWSTECTYVYSGQFYDADGVFTFAENIDDETRVVIDGVEVLRNNGDRITSTAVKDGIRGTAQTTNSNGGTPTLTFGMGPNNDGWHDIQITFAQGAGGAGPWGVSNGFNNNFGFGLNPDGTLALDGAMFLRPIDPGDGSLFRTDISGLGDTIVEDGAKLVAAQIIQSSLVIGAGATVELAPSGTLVPTAPELAVSIPTGDSLSGGATWSDLPASLTAPVDSGVGGGAVLTGAVSAVPEPATWAYLAILALMGAVAGVRRTLRGSRRS